MGSFSRVNVLSDLSWTMGKISEVPDVVMPSFGKSAPSSPRSRPRVMPPGARTVESRVSLTRGTAPTPWIRSQTTYYSKGINPPLPRLSPLHHSPLSLFSFPSSRIADRTPPFPLPALNRCAVPCRSVLIVVSPMPISQPISPQKIT